MSITRFQEYLDQKNNLQKNPRTEKVADYHGADDTKPPKNLTAKDAGGAGSNEQAKSYTNPTTPAKAQKPENGLADKGDQKLVYKPNVDGKTDGSKVATWPKTKTQEWLDNSKGLTLSEFTQKIKNGVVKDVNHLNFKTPYDLINHTAKMTSENQVLMNALIREFKKSGNLDKLVKEMLQHPESFSVLAEIFEGKDEKYAKKLMQAVNEIVAPPVHKMDMIPHHKKKMPGMPGTDDMGDHNHDHDDMGDGSDSDMDGDSDDMDSDSDMDGDGDSDELGDDSDMDSDDMGSSDDMDGDDAPEGKPIPPPPPHRKRKKSNLMAAMGGMGGGMGMGSDMGQSGGMFGM